MPYIVVFDTNILLSGLGWRGKPYECIKLARTGLIEGLTCKEILQELSEKLEFRLKFSPEQVTDTIIDLLTCLRLVTITNTLNVINNDPDDNKILECALVGKASHIVTGDRRHLLPLSKYENISIVSADNFLEIIRSSGILQRKNPDMV